MDKPEENKPKFWMPLNAGPNKIKLVGNNPFPNTTNPFGKNIKFIVPEPSPVKKGFTKQYYNWKNN